MNPEKFQGNVAVITGSSRGIGKAIALELASKGTSIVLNGRDQTRLNKAADEIRKITENVITVCCDVSTPEGGQFLIDEAIRIFNRIDILVNNTGVSMRGNFADLKPEVFRTVFESNVLAAVNPTIPAIKYLRQTKGSLVFISSLAGIRGLPFLSAYSSSKMALRALAESIRIEEKQYNIHVGLVYVGYTENDPGKEAIAADGSKIVLNPRKGKGVQTKESVAKAVLKNISRRNFITVLTPIGKLNALLQSRFPMLVEKIIIRNFKKFEKESK
jgi:short-subunit dehydrogenase